ncbi:uncharacterized protein LOC121863334 [Homarus americanus]|uniref:uncharacterized protein LOC121863334 n=1 Tax=Homarus americanus TaxID=6706 RepID=UPI001C43F485|nr:uncharacterized protein LOC121863334 [Homarus americanus]
MVERFHRQLKDAIKAQPDPCSWMDALPLVLLGIHASHKEDMDCSPADLTLGEPLRLPRNFSLTPDPFRYLLLLMRIMHLALWTQTSHPAPPRTVVTAPDRAPAPSPMDPDTPRGAPEDFAPAAREIPHSPRVQPSLIYNPPSPQPSYLQQLSAFSFGYLPQISCVSLSRSRHP